MSPDEIIAPQLDLSDEKEPDPQSGEEDEPEEPKNDQLSEMLQAVEIKGGVDKETRNVARDISRICCLTYKCGSVGLSYPRYTAAVFATPRRSGFKQTLNRIFRLGSKPTVTREAVFIRDVKTALKDQVSGFKRTARDERSADFVKKVVQWDEVEPVGST